MKAKPLYIIVDRKDRIIGYKTKNAIRKSDIYRVSGLVLVNKKKEILLAQRSWNKSHNPGKWGASAAGTIEKGESYRANIIKEAKEEVGFPVKRLKLGPRYFRRGDHLYFCQWFFARCDWPVEKFRLEKSAVAGVRWASVQEIRRLLKEKPSVVFGRVSHWETVFRQLSREGY